MRSLTTLSALAFLFGTTMAQSGRIAQRISTLRGDGTEFTSWSLTGEEDRSRTNETIWQGACRSATIAPFDRSNAAAMLQERPHHIGLELPFETRTITLDLERSEIFTDDFSVVTASSGSAIDHNTGIHYRGSLRGDPASVVAISVFGDEMMGLISTGEGDIVLGKVEGRTDDMHVLYRTSDLRGEPMLTCGTADDGAAYTKEELSGAHAKTTRCVRLYWEVNYDLYQGKGSVTNATNYVTGLFNQSATLYANDDINVQLSQVYVWDVASPYTSTSTGTLLDQFGAYRTSFNGDLANLIGYAGGGGIAWVNGICSSQARYKMAYSGVSSSYQTVPTYSWSVEVVTHEQGHLMGSKHTHACAWNGNNTAIDGCGPAAGYTEGTCAQGPLPDVSVGGTIMSYCHLTTSKIKFANGFGPQPLAVITSKINNGTCLTTCSGTGTCATPAGFAASGLTSNSASLSWTASSGANTYTLQWKPTSASTFTSVTGITGTTYALTGLSAGTSYQAQIMAVCSGGTSPVSAVTSFSTTTASCSDPYEPNGTTSTARAIAANSTVNGLINSSTDMDWFSFSNTSAQRNIKITLSGLAANYDLRLYKGSSVVANSTNSGTSNEQIIYNTGSSSSTYKVRIRGVNGAYSASQCYTLNVQISSSTFSTMGMEGTSDGEDLVEQDVITIQPNPANDMVSVVLPPHDAMVNVEMLDGLGRVVNVFTAGESAGTSNVTFDVSGQPSGIYLMRITDKGQQTVQRFVIGH